MTQQLSLSLRPTNALKLMFDIKLVWECQTVRFIDIT